MTIKILPAVGLVFATFGCVSRAPTHNELDRRSGLYGTGEKDKSYENDLKRLEVHQAAQKQVSGPVRLAPLVARVWAYDHVIEGGHWMEGTWIYLEVEASKWIRTGDTVGKGATLSVPESIRSSIQPAPGAASRSNQTRTHIRGIN